jgi:hypothetical protein
VFSRKLFEMLSYMYKFNFMQLNRILSAHLTCSIQNVYIINICIKFYLVWTDFLIYDCLFILDFVPFTICKLFVQQKKLIFIINLFRTSELGNF